MLGYTGGYQDVQIPTWTRNAIVVAVGGHGGSNEAWGGRGTRVQGTVPIDMTGGVMTVGIGASGGKAVTGDDYGSATATGGWGDNGTTGGNATMPAGYRV